MATTVLNVINGALRLLGVISSGEQASPSEAQDALAALNDMLDTWATESLLVYGSLPQSFALVPGQKVYTLGAGGNWNMPRPAQIDSMYLQYTGAGTTPPPINLPVPLLNLDQYNALMVPNTTSPITTAAYIDDSFPLRNVYMWPVPTVNYSVTLFTGALISAFAAITAAFSVPPGYSEMIRYNLALRLAAEYGLAPPQAVLTGAVSTMAAVKRNNIKPIYMACDPAVTNNKTGGFNYLIGE